MKLLYIVYFRTMEDSPEVYIECATTSRLVANEAFLKAKAEEEEWMADQDPDMGNWAEARIRTFAIPGDIKPGDTIHVVVDTDWDEVVSTEIYPLLRKEDAESLVEALKHDYLEDYPDVTPFDEDETIEESMHLEDPSEGVDIYFDIVDAKVQ